MGDNEERHRLVVLGAGQVGKSAIINRFLHKTYTESYKPTVEDLHCRDYDIHGTIIKVDILDTAGNLAFPAMRRLSISTAHAFMLVYAIDSRETFLAIREIWEEIKEIRSNYQDLPCVIVANKLDFEPRRKVSSEDGRSWARSEGMESSYLEVSAKEDYGIPQVFQKLLEQANLPNIRKLEPILKRRLSANSASLGAARERLRQQEDGSKGLLRSRSLMRRSNKPKVKNTGDPYRNDCCIS